MTRQELVQNGRTTGPDSAQTGWLRASQERFRSPHRAVRAFPRPNWGLAKSCFGQIGRTASKSSSADSPIVSATAYILMSGLRRWGLKATELAPAQASTIRTKLLKIGAQIRVTVRKVWVWMASSYPWQGLYPQVWTNVRC